MLGRGAGPGPGAGAGPAGDGAGPGAPGVPAAVNCGYVDLFISRDLVGQKVLKRFLTWTGWHGAGRSVRARASPGADGGAVPEGLAAGAGASLGRGVTGGGAGAPGTPGVPVSLHWIEKGRLLQEPQKYVLLPSAAGKRTDAMAFFWKGRGL